MHSTLHKLNSLKGKLKDSKSVIDVIWSVKTKSQEDSKRAKGTDSLDETCINHITENCSYPKSCTRLFYKLENESE
jgi:hypothetical protein